MLCTKICHDLAGPLGAVNNGAEFLSENAEDMKEQAFELIQDSAKQAISRLMLFRNIYGRINSGGEANIEALRSLVLDYFNATKIKIDWPDSHTDSAGVSIGKRMGRLLLIIIHISADSLIRGGEISIRLKKESNSKEIIVKATGATIKFEEDYKQILLQRCIDEEKLDPKNAEIYMAALLLDELNSMIRIAKSDGELEFVLENKI